MYGLAQIYIGCKCGETWNVAAHEMCDDDNCETYLICNVCGGAVYKEKEENGLKCMHAITEEEHLQLSGFYEDIEDDELDLE